MKACIAGIEIDLPQRVVKNADLAREHPDWDMDKIAQHTGVFERHVCADGETALDIGQRASERLLELRIISTLVGPRPSSSIMRVWDTRAIIWFSSGPQPHQRNSKLQSSTKVKRSSHCPSAQTNQKYTP